MGISKRCLNYHQQDSGYEAYCVGVSNFKNNTSIRNTNNLALVNITSKPSKEYFLKRGDIVFVRSNGSQELVGRTVLIQTDLEITFSGFCIRFRNTSSAMNSFYLLSLLNNPSLNKGY